MDGSGGLTADTLLSDAEQRETTDARNAFLRGGLQDAILLGSATAVVLAIIPLEAPAVLTAAFAIAVFPFLLATAILGLARAPFSFAVVGLFSVTALAGAYALTLSMGDNAAGNLAWTASLFALALTPQIVAFASARLVPSDEKGAPPLPCARIGLVSVATSFALVAIAAAGSIVETVAIDTRLLAALFVVTLLPPVLASWAQARRERKLPVKSGDKQPDHISGVGATSLIVFVGLIVTLGFWAATTGVNAQISIYAGLIVLLGLIVVFGLVAFGLPASRTFAGLYDFLKDRVKLVGWLFSFVDSVLVFAIAAALGANERNVGLRFGLLLGSLLNCAALGWFLPAPYGLIPLGLALIGAIAMARRWAWVEEDRENAMLAGKFEGDHIRVGFAQDLKDEALIGYSVLFIIVPIMLRQVHSGFGGNVFITTGNVDDLFAWLSFFGTELAKAVPFVDWAEIYRIEGDALISLDDKKIGAGQHVVFAMRILVDLVLLAALLQAISITQRTRKLKDMFYVAHSLDRLDPFIEPHEFRKLVRMGSKGFELVEDEFKNFPVYDPDRLEQLKSRGERHSADRDIAFVATRLLVRDESISPEEHLFKEAQREKPDRDRCMDFLDRVRSQGEVDPGPLKAAHYVLRRRAPFMLVRLGIAEQIARALPDDERAVNALSEILIGPSTGPLSPQDPRQEVRMVALHALFRVAIAGNTVARSSIRHAAANDSTAPVKKAAKEMLEFSSDW